MSAAIADALVVGGGPAGLAAAIALRQHGRSAIVLERGSYRGPRVGEHLSERGRQALDRLGFAVSDEHRRASEVRSVWGDDHVQSRHSLLSTVGDALHLSRPLFDEQLAHHARANGVTVHRDAPVHGVERVGDRWRVTCAAGAFHADVVIDATGRAARVARRLGARSIALDSLQAAVAYLDLDSGSHVQVEACEHGWWYSAGLAGGRTIAAWMFDREQALRTPEAAWRAALAHAPHTRARLGAVSPRRFLLRDARTRRLIPTSGRDWLAIGDAAAALDPLSSSGLGRALDDGWKAAAAIASTDDPGFAGYQRHRHRQQAFTAFLLQRAQVYRAEMRFAHASFWRCRHRRLPHEQSLSLSATGLLEANGDVAPPADMLALFGVDPASILALAQRPRPAHTLADALRREHALGDRDAVLAVQYLRDTGALRSPVH